MNFKQAYRTGREIVTHKLSVLTNHVLLLFYYCFHQVLKSGLILTSLPAIAIGCSDQVLPDKGKPSGPSLSCNQSIFLQMADRNHGSILDILVFENDRHKRLDSYQRIEDFDRNDVNAASTGGEKIFFLYCGGTQKRAFDWTDIYSYQSLGKLSCDLEDEDRSMLHMTGCFTGTGGENVSNVLMTPLVSEISLNSLRCDFSGTSYAGETVKNLKAYLTNVNASCTLLPEEKQNPLRIINSGMLCHSDLTGFADRSILVQDIADELSQQTIYPKTSLLCYPNCGSDNRRTRLVLEGTICGETCYWPILICGDKGVERNNRYQYDILLRRKGVSRPDLDMHPTDIEIELKIKPWLEKEEYQVRF